MSNRSLPNRLWYQVLRWLICLTSSVVFGVRYFGRGNIPKRGPVLVVSNHQSHFDPPLIGSGCWRRMNYLARESLFRFAAFGWLIRSLDAIPIDRDGLGLKGIKESLRRLKRGRNGAHFPRRHADPRWRGGAPFARDLPYWPPARMPGFCPSPSKGPMIAGRERGKFPVAARFTSTFGRPIPPEEVAAL